MDALTHDSTESTQSHSAGATISPTMRPPKGRRTAAINPDARHPTARTPDASSTAVEPTSTPHRDGSKDRSRPASPKRSIPELMEAARSGAPVTVPELARIMACSRQHVWSLCKAGRVRTIPSGDHNRIPGDEVVRITCQGFTLC